MVPRARILIFGGSFNPPTLAHEAIIRACLGLPQFDQVWVMPSCSRLDKAIATSDEQRLEMLKAVCSTAFGGNSRLVVSDLELRLGAPTQLRRTLAELSATHPDTEFWFAYGGDAYQDMANWEDANEFMRDIRVVVFTEYELPEVADGRLLQLHLPSAVHDVSSSQVRAVVARGGDANAWLSEPVRRYIAEHELYQT